MRGFLDWSVLIGTFGGSPSLPDLPSWMEWDTSNLYTTGEIRAVPEPTSLVLIVAVIPLLRRKRPRQRT